MKSNYILHLDLDGVLTDFDGAFAKVAEGLTPTDYAGKHGNPERKELYFKQPVSFWADMKWIEGGRELVECALSHFKVVRILTSAGTGRDWKKFKEVSTGKHQWLETHLPMVDKKNIIVVPFANLKSRHSGPDRMLVDDKDTTITQFNEKGGIGILHLSSNWQNSVDELKEYASVSLGCNK
jgi:5'(3')-deoxyribonucleotidase